MTSGRVRIVILNYNTPTEAVECVRGCAAQSYTAKDICVVDNASTPQNRTTLRRLLRSREFGIPVTLLESERNGGYAAGNNLGICSTALPSPEFVMVINSDIVVRSPTLLSSLVSALAEYPRAAGASPLVNTEHTGMAVEDQLQVRRRADLLACIVSGSWWLRRLPLLRRTYAHHVYADLMPFRRGIVYDVESLNGACFLIRRDFVEQIGGLDEGTFLYFEELILAEQARLLGARFLLCSSEVVEHQQGLSTGQAGSRVRWQMYRHYVNSQCYYLARYLHAGLIARLLLRGVRATDFITKRVATAVTGALARMSGRRGR